MSQALCRHCGRRPPNRARGMCWHCYHLPGVRERYGSDKPGARRSFPDFTGMRRVGRPVPTAALPGTAEKLAVLEGRASRGEALFDPADARVPLDGPPAGAQLLLEEAS